MPSIDVTMNARAAQSGAKDVAAALDNVADSLDDVAAAAKRDGDRAETAIEGVGDAATSTRKEIDKAGDKIEATFKDLVTQAKKADTALENVGDTGKKSFVKASEATAEFKEEALQNFSEVTSSFDGSMSSVTDLVQGTLGGLASSLPGIGIAAGVAAAGVGLIGSAFEAAEEHRQELQDRADDLASAYIDAGSTVLDTMTLASNISDILTDSDQKKAAQEYADALGVDLSEAVRIMAGDTNALAAQTQRYNDAQAELNALNETTLNQGNRMTSEQQARRTELQKLTGAYEELNGVQSTAAETAKTYSDSLKAMVNDAESATKEVDELGNAVYTLPDGTQIMIDAETQQATTDVSNFKGDLDGVPETVTSTVKVNVDDSAVRNWQAPLLPSATVKLLADTSSLTKWQ